MLDWLCVVRTHNQLWPEHLQDETARCLEEEDVLRGEWDEAGSSVLGVFTSDAYKASY